MDATKQPTTNALPYRNLLVFDNFTSMHALALQIANKSENAALFFDKTTNLWVTKGTFPKGKVALFAYNHVTPEDGATGGGTMLFTSDAPHLFERLRNLCSGFYEAHEHPLRPDDPLPVRYRSLTLE